MIARLRGKVVGLSPVGATESTLILDVNGVGYLVGCTERLRLSLSLDQFITLSVETHVREDRIQLFGFSRESEKAWFKLLQTVQGVGAKVALALLSALSPTQLVQSILAQDKALLTQADGIGGKIAARLVAELKDKIPHVQMEEVDHSQPTSAENSSQPMTEAIPILENPSMDRGELITDAVSALHNLGYARAEAYGTVMRIHHQNQTVGLADLIRASLQELAA